MLAIPFLLITVSVYLILVFIVSYTFFSRVHEALSLMKTMDRVCAQDAGAQTVHAV